MNDKKDITEKMALESMDIGSENRTRLKALFPSVFIETEYYKAEQIVFRTV